MTSHNDYVGGFCSKIVKFLVFAPNFIKTKFTLAFPIKRNNLSRPKRNDAVARYNDGISRFDDGITRYDSPDPAPNIKIPMAKVALKLSRKKLDQKLDLGTTIVAGLTGNANFTTPVPALATITASITSLRALNVSRQTHIDAAEAITIQIAAGEAALDGLLNQIAGYGEVTVNFDAAKLAAAGFPLQSDAAPVGNLLPPENFTMTIGDHAGQVDGHCDRMRGATGYTVEYSTSATGPWTQGYHGSRSQFSITGLVSGTLYYFRMSATGANGDSEWTGITEKRAP